MFLKLGQIKQVSLKNIDWFFWPKNSQLDINLSYSIMKLAHTILCKLLCALYPVVFDE